MGDLTKHFSRREFACKCCGREGVDLRLVKALQSLRELAGAPIRVNSGWRCPNHYLSKRNPRSQHMLGTAADIVIDELDVLGMFELAERIPSFNAGGIGVYPHDGFIHVDVRDVRARWGFLHGREVALETALNEARKIRARSS
jgi:uncharacterized protein YcbK (DUF882 family)